MVFITAGRQARFCRPKLLTTGGHARPRVRRSSTVFKKDVLFP